MSTAPETPENPPIIVQGYTPRYWKAASRLIGVEGGHVNDPLDRGGETKYGVSLRFLAAEGAFDDDGDGKADFDLDMDGDIDGADIRLLTKGDATYLFHRCFWQRLQAETFAEPLGEMMFDQAVNGGLTTGRKLLQRAVNQCLLQIPMSATRRGLLTVDGDIADMTRAALNDVMTWPKLGVPALVTAYRDAARERYRLIARRFPSQQRYLNGWLARADQLGR